MALNTLNLGPSFGQSLASSLGGSIEALTQNKLREIQHGQRLKGLESLGFSPEKAQSYSTLDPNLLQLVVQQKLQEPSQIAFGKALESIIGGGAQADNINPPTQQNNQMTQEQFEQLQQAVPHLMLPGIPDNKAPASLRQPKAKQIPPQVLAQLNPQQAMQLAQLGLQQKALGKKETEAQKKILREENRLSKQESFKEQLVADKETRPLYDEIAKEGKAAKSSNVRLNRLEHLNEKGSLPFSALYRGFKALSEAHVGGYIPIVGPLADLVLNTAGGLGLAVQRGITSPDTEEYEKILADFNRDLKTIFGARITNFDIQQFEKMLPSLVNTQAGRQKIIKNMKTLNNASILKEKVAQDIMKENGGHRPFNFKELVDQRSDAELNEIAEQFRVGLSPVA